MMYRFTRKNFCVLVTAVLLSWVAVALVTYAVLRLLGVVQ